MTDRKLLELAAKAAGMSGGWGKERYIEQREGWIPSGWRRRWSPLEDDGDALRLAVTLRINIEHMMTSRHRPFGVNCWPVGRGDCGISEEGDLSDYGAATRRAIVRAAAEIGKATPKGGA